MLLEPVFRKSDIERKLLDYFVSHDRTHTVAIVPLLLARPSDEFVKTKLLENFLYWHLRSEDYVNFFCVGYVPYYHCPESRPTGIRLGGHEWGFSEEAFTEFLSDFESITDWRFNGNPTLIIFNAQYDGETTGLDYTECISIDLVDANGLAHSPTKIFEEIIRFSRESNKNNVNLLRKYSDAQGASLIKTGFKEWFLSHLPSSINKTTKQAIMYATQQHNCTPKNNVLHVDFKSKK
ncbi:hypothetical protein [Vibrio parahaemolyticus]|uniref:hypothetical protein n=1 Tax=Vibrio parahaemolyticus TaxID=670 RepID=UPI00041B298A|nr:hypothetical protein [Vibrio parahaemolyticus]KJR15559.1 hypothetical protein UF28_18090 [Vibrio parahaemolyticus]MDF4588237.1 hypothetical protein [Vibrio parahaemolyticus]